MPGGGGQLGDVWNDGRATRERCADGLLFCSLLAEQSNQIRENPFERSGLRSQTGFNDH